MVENGYKSTLVNTRNAYMSPKTLYGDVKRLIFRSIKKTPYRHPLKIKYIFIYDFS